MTPARLAFIRESVGDLTGLSVLDVGCGGGLMAEPMCRQGAQVTGIDAGAAAIDAARHHAAAENLAITYAVDTLEHHAGTYDVVCALDIIEHVDNPPAFVAALAAHLKPNGRLVLSTLNRTWKSYAFGIVAAEQLLGLAPKGSHQWDKFVEPAELAAMCRDAGLKVTQLKGLCMNPLSGDFSLSQTRLGINYMLCAKIG